MRLPTVSKLPELVIFGDPLPKSRFSVVSATVFYANRITGNIWLRVLGPQWTLDVSVQTNTLEIKCSAGKRSKAVQRL